MRVHIVQHTPFDMAGYLKEWAKAHGHSWALSQSSLGGQLPAVDDYDFLIVLGGLESVLEIDKYPYLLKEIELIQESVAKDKLILGFCLGAQLISKALGAQPERSPQKEVGVFPIELTKRGKESEIFKDLPEELNVVHWHYDMIGIPEGADLLACTEACPNQAFKYGNNIYGFQFHMEINDDIAKKLVESAASDLETIGITQDRDTFLAQDFQSINESLHQILDRITHSQRLH